MASSKLRGEIRTLSAARRRFRPMVESVERRELLSVAMASADAQAANRAYLASLQDAFMTGSLNPKREAALLGKLDSGLARPRVVRELLNAPEVVRRQAMTFYQSELNRDPNAREVKAIGATFRAGGDLRNVFVRLAGGVEYAKVRGGGTRAGFVGALFQDVLGRPPAGNEARSWLSRLNAGESRSALARAMVNTPEARARLARNAIVGAAGQGGMPTLNAARKIAARRGGENLLVARTFGSQTVFDSATVAVDLAAPPTDAGPQIHPPGLPLAPGLDLGTRWTELTSVSGPTFDGTNLIAAAPDGSIWATGPANNHDQLYIYQPGTYAYVAATQTTPGVVPLLPGWVSPPKLSAPIVSLSAISQGLAWAIMPIGGVNHFVTIDGVGHVTDQGSPPIGAPDSLSVATDGTRLALLDNGSLVEYAGSTPTSTVNLPPGYNLISFTVGSASNIWALAGKTGEVAPTVLHLVNGAWQVDPVVAGATPSSISATADGSVWAWNNQNVYLRPGTTGVWQQAMKTIATGTGTYTTSPVTPPSPMTYGAAFSQFRMGAILSDHTLRILSVGVADQQSVPDMPTDPQELAAYNAISTFFNAVSPVGIRGDYDNSLQQSKIQSDSTTTIPDSIMPSTVSPAVWKAMKDEIHAELGYVGQVYTLFEQLARVRHDIEISNNNIQSGVLTNVQASVSPLQGSDSLAMLFGNGLEAVLWGIAASVSGGSAVIGAIIASAFGSSLSYLTSNPNPDSNTELDITYSALTQTMQALYDNYDAQNLLYETAILTNWTNLAAVGREINDPLNPWFTPGGSSSVAADATQPGFTLFYYQSLMPAKWQTVYYPAVPCEREYLFWKYCPKPQFGDFDYDIYSKVVGQNSDGPLTDYRYINELGGDVNLYGNPSPYPTKALLQAIYNLGVSQETLFSAQGNWNLKVVQGGF